MKFQLQNSKKELADALERHEVQKKELENKFKRENESEVNKKVKLSKNSFNEGFATLVENIRVNELEKTLKKQRLEIEKKTKENVELKDSNDGLNNQITVWEESNKNLQDEMTLQKSIFEKKSNEVSDLKATINELKNEISDLKKSSMNPQQDINPEKMKLVEKYQKLEENYEAKCREVEKLQSENQCQIADLEVQKTKIQEYELKNIFFQKRHSTELKKQAKDHQIKINIWEESNKNLQDEMSLQKSIFEKKSNEVSDLKATINELKNEISLLKKSSMNSQKDIIHETGEKEKKDWEVKYESYVKLCQKKSEELNSWKEKHELALKDLKLKESNFKYQCEQYKKVMSNLEEKLANMKEERNTMRNEILDKNQINQELHHQKSELKVQFDEMENIKERIIKDLKNLIQEKKIKLQDEKSKLLEFSKNNNKLLLLIHKKDQEFEAKEQELLNQKATCTCHISFDFQNVQQNVVIKKEIKQEPPDEDDQIHFMEAQESLNKQAKKFKS